MLHQTGLSFQNKSGRGIDDGRCLTAYQVVPDASNDVDIVEAMCEPGDDPRHGKAKLLVLELFEDCLERGVSLHRDEVYEFVEHRDRLLKCVEKGVAQVGGCHPMRDVVADVAAEYADEHTHHIVEALEVLIPRLILGEGVEQFQQVILLDLPYVVCIGTGSADPYPRTS